MELNEEDDRVFMRIGEMPRGTFFSIPDKSDSGCILYVAFSLELKGGKSYCAMECSENYFGNFKPSEEEIFRWVKFKTNDEWKSLEIMKPGQSFFNNRGEKCQRVAFEKDDDPVAYRCSDSEIIFRKNDTIINLECEVFLRKLYKPVIHLVSLFENKEIIFRTRNRMSELQENSTEARITKIANQPPTPEEKPVKKRGRKARGKEFKERIEKEIDDFGNSPELHKLPAKENPLDAATKKRKEKIKTEEIKKLSELD